MEKKAFLKNDLKDRILQANKKLGVEELSDEDLISLASESILKSYTFQEKGYR